MAKVKAQFGLLPHPHARQALRADLTVLESDEHIAEWIRLSEEKDKPAL
jgi:hypothetical protein